MKNLKMFKKVSIIFLGLVFAIVCSGKVFAADDGLFTTIDSTNNTSNSATNGNNTTNTDTNTNTNTDTNNVTNGSLTTNSANNTSNTNNSIRNTATNNTANTNRNVSNTGTLAKTGLPNTGAIVAVVLVVCGISAIYSYKKVNDYKKL